MGIGASPSYGALQIPPTVADARCDRPVGGAVLAAPARLAVYADVGRRSPLARRVEVLERGAAKRFPGDRSGLTQGRYARTTVMRRP
jgi:hypothetical protein